MMRYSVQPKYRIFLKGYRFCLLPNIWVKIMVPGKNISKKGSGKYSQKRF